VQIAEIIAGTFILLVVVVLFGIGIMPGIGSGSIDIPPAQYKPDMRPPRGGTGQSNKHGCCQICGVKIRQNERPGYWPTAWIYCDKCLEEGWPALPGRPGRKPTKLAQLLENSPWPVMEPDTRSNIEIARGKWLHAAYDCKHIGLQNGYPFDYSAECLLDRQHRNCTGRCNKYEFNQDVPPPPEPPPLRRARDNVLLNRAEIEAWDNRHRGA